MSSFPSLHQRMPFPIHWQRAGTGFCPEEEEYGSDDLLGRTGSCCSLFPSPCPTFVSSVGKARTLCPSLSFTSNECCHHQSDCYFFFFCLLFPPQKSFHMNLRGVICDTLLVALVFISLLPCLSWWLFIKDSFVSLASTQAVGCRCIWTMQYSAETSQPCTEQVMSMAGSSGLMLTWCCTRASFISLMRTALRLQAEQEQVVMFAILEQCRYAVTWVNLNYVPGCAVQDPQWYAVGPAQDCSRQCGSLH